jgi:hypothetical protein
MIRIRALPDLVGYNVPQGDPLCHKQIAWFAREDDRALGVVILDRIDHDFSWVALEKTDGAWQAADVGASLATQDAATTALHEAMRAIGGAVKDGEPQP